MTNPGNQNNNRAGNSKIQSFLEALRNSQGRSFEGGNQEPGSNPFTQFKEKKEAEKRRSEQFLQARQQEWNQVFSSKEKKTEQRIEEIRKQLIVLVKQVRILDKNMVKAVGSPIIKTGVYHENFLTHIQKMIHLFSLQVQETNSWLAMYNSRSTKKGFYLGMAKTGGTSFTQANERSVATSVG